MSELTPKHIVEQLDNHIIGQADAKKSVAIALRNRWRRMQVSDEVRDEITPKNILMIGPTGVGKTEISRRLALLTDAPFIKVEATKFTEVGYVGRDVESIIRDLVDITIKKEQQKEKESVQQKSYDNAVERVLDILLPEADKTDKTDTKQETPETKKTNANTREKFRKKIIEGKLDDKEIEINLSQNAPHIEIATPMGMDDIGEHLQDIMKDIQSSKKNKRKITIEKALKILKEEEAESLIDKEKIREKTTENVAQNGIVFLDEIDKVINTDKSSGGVSRDGVQRDLLPLIEGCSVSTKHGVIDTNHILFIASGAFHLAKPADLIPELQGRLPIRVELKALSVNDFYRILTEPKMSLIEQYQVLLKTEGFKLTFEKSALERIAQLAFEVNENTQNIGARRLHTMLERLLEDICFEVPDVKSKATKITKKFVDEKLAELSQNQDLSRYIL